MKNERDKVALITGASSGIGRACAEKVAEGPYVVYGTSRRPRANLVTEDGEPKVRMLQMDVNSQASVEAGVETILEQWGRIDIVVNNAGFGYGGAIEDTSIEEAKATFETNFFGPLRVCQAVLPAMRAQGSGLIVNIGSIGGRMGLPFQGLYSASKFALGGLTESLRMEVKSFGIDVVLIEPGDTRTSFTDNRRLTEACQAHDAYRDQCNTTLAKVEEDERNGAAPELVAKSLMRVLKHADPKPRYIAGRFYERLAVWAKDLLPDRLFERILMINYGVKQGGKG
jgi:NAD(P)-dependent dehydrogenase (short-subunit alcohol dehydrogenase family)